MDRQYNEIARLLINLELISGNKKVIATLGFYIALHKQGLWGDSYDFVYKEVLAIDSNNSVRLHDVCSMLPIKSHLHSFVQTICVIPDLDHAKLFEAIISIYAYEEGRRLGEFYQPKEITHLITALLKSKDVRSVYNPFSGIASYQLDNVSAHYYSQEINKDTWLIGKIRLLLNCIKTDFVCEDSIANWKCDDWKFDGIVATIPFGLLIQREEFLTSSFPKHTSAEEFFIYKGLEGLKKDGMLIGVFSSGVLFKGGFMQEVRKEIIEQDLLDIVITLPQNTFSNTSISTVVLLLSKRKKRTGHVRMVDGSSFFKKEGRNCIVKWEEIYHTIEKDDSKYVKLIANETIEANEYNFSTGQYLNDVANTVFIPEGFELKKLKKLLSINRGGRCNGGKYRLVKGKDLADDKFLFDKTFEELPIEDTNSQFTVLDKDLLLLLRIGKLKPTYFHYVDGIDVCCNQNILAFEFNTDIVNPQYLVNELSKEYVTKQVNSRSNGVAMQSIALKDLLEIEVLISTVDKQELVFDEEKRFFQEQKIKELGLEINLLKIAQYSEFERNMRLRKHALAQVISNFSSAFRLIQRCKEKHNGVLEDSDIVSSRTGETVAEYFQKLPNYVSKVEGLIDALVDQESYGEAECVWLDGFIEKYKKNHIASNYSIELFLNNTSDYDLYIPGFELNGEINDSNDIKKGDPIESKAINISPRDLTQIIDNIVSNARKYGFTNQDRRDYSIRIETKDIDIESIPMISIKISNNGSSLPKGMDKSKFFHWGIGEGTGLGTWQIKNIVEHYGGSVVLNEYPHDLMGFEVEYELIFPKVNTL